ncbi:RcpC/CpaB family pilus assembly protein [Paenibacillus hunanensis]|uniref:RcpC/CpaB family pilus assembly protein n=1 Tax=Paenibacillus hunanensis TaxID=539262 RepID=UPI002026BC43|nr:RcpC/CpaB family pilus assembly protein [Paenibacillus hunanensis]
MSSGKKKILAFIMALVVVAAFVGITQYRVQSEVQPTLVYIANQDIAPHTLITEDMVSGVELPEKGIAPQVVLKKSDIVGHYTQVNYGVPQNGFFYSDKVVTQDQLADAVRMKLKPGQVLWTGTVDIEESAAGNVVPGSLVDIWMSTSISGTKEPVVGRLYKDVYVLSTKNKKGEDITNNAVTKPAATDSNKTTTVTKEYVPSVVQLAVSDDQYQMLKAAKTGVFATSIISLVPKAGGLVNKASDIPENTTADPYDMKPFVLAQLRAGEAELKRTDMNGVN